MVKEIGENEYKSYIVVDFNEATKKTLDAFDNLRELDIFFQTLSLEYNTRLYPRASLIIFDEIQKFPKARQAIKYLVADGRYDYIETGSLISIKENVEGMVIPSEEEKVQMHPLDFEEFLLALGEDVLADYIKDCWRRKEPLDDRFHRKATRLFREFLLVGGMPQSLRAYLENGRSFYASDSEKRDILSLYRNDIGKAAVKLGTSVVADDADLAAVAFKIENVCQGSTIKTVADGIVEYLAPFGFKAERLLDTA